MLGTWDAQNAPGGEKVNNCNENGIEISWQMHFCVAMPNFSAFNYMGGQSKEDRFMFDPY